MILTPILAVWLGKMLSGKFILNRAAAGTGSAYFYHKGKKTGRKRYYATAIAIYVVSWILLLAGVGYVVALLIRWFRFRIPIP